MTPEIKDYRADMDWPIEELGSALASLGFKREQLSDAELVQVATRKLRTLHEIAQTVLTPGILAAVMKE